MSIAENLKHIVSRLPANVKLIAVSKTQPIGTVLQAYQAGHKIFGENKAQELVDKYEALPKDIEWHMIGHLQTNKVKYVVPFVHMIHGVDSLKLLKVINKEALKNDRVINCLLQVHIAREETKFGFSEEEIYQVLDSEEYRDLQHIRITGVMGMATFTEDTDVVRQEFRMLKNIFKKLKDHYFQARNEFREISMGMSSDYMVAIEEGSTMVRIGTFLFGERSYS